jgi:hypothetical protein
LLRRRKDRLRSIDALSGRSQGCGAHAPRGGFGRVPTRAVLASACRKDRQCERRDSRRDQSPYSRGAHRSRHRRRPRPNGGSRRGSHLSWLASGELRRGCMLIHFARQKPESSACAKRFRDPARKLFRARCRECAAGQLWGSSMLMGALQADGAREASGRKQDALSRHSEKLSTIEWP